jgi:hypothetical protein
MPPLALIVDDEPEGEHYVVRDLKRFGMDAAVLHPRDVTEMSVQRATVIAVDEYLTNWAERDEAPPALRPADGIALAAIFRSQAESAAPPTARVAIVIRTGDLQRLSSGLPQATAEHLVAAERDVDWVFPKASLANEPDTSARLASLGHAVASLPSFTEQPDVGPLAALGAWLGLKDETWAAAALRDVEDCRPPIHDLAEHSGGRSVLRWLAQRVLPYPGFLIDDARLAVRLGVTRSAVSRVLAGKSRLSAELSSTRYSGALADFLGDRWWRAGINDFLRREAGESVLGSDAIANVLTRLAGRRLERLDIGRPVLCLDEDLKPIEVPTDVESAVRVLPDGWPSWADEAWMEMSTLVADPSLLRLVAPSDRGRVEGVLRSERDA